MPRGCPRLRLGTAAVGTLPARVHGGPIKEQTRTGWSRLLLDFGMRLLSFFTDFDPVNREMFTVFDRDFQGL